MRCFFFCFAAAAAAAAEVRLALLMLMRDEEKLVREHLPLWVGMAWCAVGAVDERSTDKSGLAFLEAAPQRRFLYYYAFSGLGSARTLLIGEACAHFPEATHALFVDPDWRPVFTSLASLEEAVQSCDACTVFVFRIFDRNRNTERLLDWCFRLSPDVVFKYRWHEVLVVPSKYVPRAIPWDVEEVAGADQKSYHAKAHGHAASAARYAFEIDLLERDLRDDPADPRLHYYLGVDYVALARPGNSSALDRGRDHLERHIALAESHVYAGSARDEMTYVAMLQLAYAYARLDRRDDAEAVLVRAEGYDAARAEAPLQAARLRLSRHQYLPALEAALRATTLPVPTRTFYHHPGAYACDGLRVVLAALRASSVDIIIAPTLASAARRAVDRFDTECDGGPSDEIRRRLETMIIKSSSEEIVDDVCAPETEERVAEALATWRDTPVTAISALRAASDADAPCCAPRREFARLFLGEAPESARLNETARNDLDAALATATATAAWREQGAYALASLRSQRGDARGALAALEPLFNHRLAASPRRRAFDAASRLSAIVTVASQDTKTLQNLRDSVAAANQSLVVLGLGAPYTGHETKLKYYRDWLAAEAKLSPGSLVLLVDAYDVVVWPAILDFGERFESFDADVVFGGDATCYPDLEVAEFYYQGDKPATETRSRRGPFVNSGTIAGTAAALLAVFRAALALGSVATCGPDDQRAFHRVYLRGVPGVAMKVDSQGLLFHSLHRDLRHLWVDDCGQLRVDDPETSEVVAAATPCVTHGNAGDGKALYGSVVAAWRRAREDRRVVVVEPDLYMHGLELWRRGRAAEAREAWEAYVDANGCGATYAAVARYNLGVLHDHLHHPAAALPYYEAAIECAPNHGDAMANAGVARARLGDRLGGIAYLIQAFRTNPTNAHYSANLAQLQGTYG